MREIELKPIFDKRSYYLKVFEVLDRWMMANLYAPLFSIVDEKVPKTVENARKSELVRSLEMGKIFYQDGFFYGKHTSSTSKILSQLGATFNKTTKGWKLGKNKVPLEISTAISVGVDKHMKQLEKLEQFIAESQKKIPKIVFTDKVEEIFGDLHSQFVKTVKPENLEVPMEMSKGIEKDIKESYSKNVELYLKDWTKEATERLREKVAQTVAQGYRSDRMKEILISEYGISKNKARLIARQETSLMVSRYREARYKESGVKKYRWSTSNDVRVRQDHKDLNGSVFTWDSPPIVDKQTGRRGHPGEDFGCRCVAVPVLTIAGKDYGDKEDLK